MTEASQRVHTASVTYSVRDTVFDGLEIHANDIMGLIDNKIEHLGTDAGSVAKELLKKMVTDDISLITVYYGSDISEDTASTLTEEIAGEYPDCEVDFQLGGQPLYYYLIAVE